MSQFHSFTAKVFFLFSLLLLQHAANGVQNEPRFTGNPLNDRLGQTPPYSTRKYKIRRRCAAATFSMG